MRLILDQVPEFTHPQITAIDIERLGEDACIVAGPGSGKTTVLVERYRRLIEEGVLPREILAITFTEKAAANMKDKMAKAFAADPQKRRQIEAAYISTVHGFCQRLLKENAIAAGVDPQFSILDERQGQIRRARCAVETLDTFFREHEDEAGALMAAIEHPELAGPLVEVHDAIRSAGIAFDEILEDVPDVGQPLTAQLCPRSRVPPTEASRRGADAVSGQALETIFAFIDEYRSFTGKFTDRQLEYRDDLAEWSAAARIAYRDHRWDRLVGLTAEFRFLPSKVHRGWKADFEEVTKRAEDLLGAAVVKLYARERRTLVEILQRFDRNYADEKQKLGMLDFSDLEYFAIRLLQENPAVRDRVQSQFRQILMDEYQDTNGQQARLLELLRGRGNFYAVGDINQSIFGFRHATPEVFRRHRDQVRTARHHYVELFDNFRSRADILRAVEAVMEDAAGVEARELNACRNLPLKDAPCVEVTAALGETNEDASRIEAEWIAARVLELRGSLTIGQESRPAEFRDMAVLERKTSIVGPIAEAFDRCGVQYQVTRQIGFFESREIRDLTHLLRAISNPRDEVSLAVVLRSPFAGLSDEALLRLKDGVDNLAVALDEETPELDPLDAERFRQFRASFARWRSRTHFLPVDRLLAEAMADCGYGWMPSSAAGANIEKLLLLARNAPRDQSLAEFVHEIKLIREDDAREADAPFDEALDAVRVITAHASKGLEFPIVFIPGMQNRMSAGIPDLTFTTAGGLGAKWRNPSGGEMVSDWFRTRNKMAIRQRESDESERLLYVAMTRAEEHLILSYALGEKEKTQQWAAPVAQVLEMASLEPDAPPRIVQAGIPGREFAAIVRAITRNPAALPLEPGGASTSGIQEIARPAMVGPEESSVTVTALTLFADCPRRYYLARYLGWEPDARKPSPSSELGRQVHALLAGQEVPAPELEALRLADTFDRSALGRRARKARHAEHEFEVLFAIGDRVLRGQIDLWFEDRNGQTVVDYKTDDVAASEAEARAESYKLQLRYYALAIEKLTGALPTEAWLHFLRPDVAVRVELTGRDLQAARQLVDDLASAQRENQFPLKEGPHCGRCPFYRGKCPAGSR